MRTFLSASLAGAILLASASAENLLENGSFEQPAIKGRTPLAKGGNPALAEGKNLWTSLTHDVVTSGGNLIVGLTDEIAQEGKQSLFVDFEKLTAGGKRATLSSELLPVRANQVYRVSIWGRLDRERPLSLDERRPHMLVEAEFFAADQETQLGSTEFRIQMIPGSVVPGLGTRLVFISARWSEYQTEFKAPTDAAFMKVAFNFEVSREEGETDGILFLDNAAVSGERGTTRLTDKESAEDTPTGEQTTN